MLRLFLFLGLLPGAWAVEPALMPLPVKLSPAAGALAIDRSFTVAAADASDPRLEAAMVRLTARLARQTGIPMPGQKTYHTGDATLRIECGGRGAAYPAIGDDESYTLHITPQGAVLRAAEVAGALHGIETFAQLVAPAAGGFAAPAVDIEDRPRFAWRGLMLDCSRHFMPVELIERNLDAMAGVKLNVFHWHLSDDQGFRAESESYPKLQGMGSDGLYYTRDDMRRVVAYARDRGIRVVPEFDVPGHTTSWLVGYPELASAPGPYTIGRTWGVYENALDPTKEETYAFLDKLVGDMAALFPDPYFHIGGDEVVAKQWNANPQIQAFMRAHNVKDAHALQAYFNQRVSEILKKHGKIMIGWDEILHPDLPQGTVVQSWRGQKSLADAAAKGFRGILSWGYYLDHLSPARYHYGIDPLAGGAAQLTAGQAQLILGGEACMWAEYVSAETVDSRIWPRAAAIAERLWSPKETADVESMYARMASVSRWLEWSGVQHRANYGPMLDRLAGNRPAEPVRVLADAVEGLGLGGRRRPGFKYTSETPLNRLADAARPESELVHGMEMDAARVAAGGRADEAARLRERFALWAANDARFQPLAEDDALLAELRPLSKDLSAVGAAGLKALDLLASGQKAPANWLEEQGRELTRMQRTGVEVSLAAMRPVKILLDELAKSAR